MLRADPAAVNGTNADGISALHQCFLNHGTLKKLQLIKYIFRCYGLASCPVPHLPAISRYQFVKLARVAILTIVHPAWPKRCHVTMGYVFVALGKEWRVINLMRGIGFSLKAGEDFCITNERNMRYLLDHGANIAAVNSDGDVPLDIAEADNMEALLRAEIMKRGVDVEVAKREEEEMMLRDARHWLNAGKIYDEPHPKTGATALHVAAAKGYVEVMRLLLQAGYDTNVQDKDGWAPLHAAAHWGVEEACRLLAEHFCDMEALNNVGQRPCDLADEGTLSLLEELQHKQNDLRSKKEAHRQAVIDTSLEQAPSYTSKHRRSSVCRMSSKEKISVQDQSKERKTLGTIAVGEEETSSASEGDEIPESNEVKAVPPTDSSAVNGVSVTPIRPLSPCPLGPKFSGGPSRITEPGSLPDPATWRQNLRKTSSFGVLQDAKLDEGVHKGGSGIKRSASSPRLDTEEKQDIQELLKKWNKNPIGPWLANRNTASEPPGDPNKEPRLARVIPTPTRRIFALPDTEPHRDPRRANLEGGLQMKIDTAPAPHQPLSSTTISSSMDPQDHRRSYQTPVRDEESESQRKARSRLMRQSRRSTQGVTLTDLKEAEKTMGWTSDSKIPSEQRNKEDEKRDKEGEQQSQETTDSARRFRLLSSDSSSVYTVNPLVVNSQLQKGTEVDKAGSELDTDLRNRLAIRDRRKGRRERRITGLGGNSEVKERRAPEEAGWCTGGRAAFGIQIGGYSEGGGCLLPAPTLTLILCLPKLLLLLLLLLHRAKEPAEGSAHRLLLLLLFSDHLNSLLPNRTAPSGCQRGSSAPSGCREEPDNYYKKLYEDLLIENEKLKEQLQEAQLQLTQIKLELERVTQVRGRA
ncbi:hypothetical protein Chor_009367, partial [Crotalus horridus]